MGTSQYIEALLDYKDCMEAHLGNYFENEGLTWSAATTCS
jgi:hypothetical protein